MNAIMTLLVVDDDADLREVVVNAVERDDLPRMYRMQLDPDSNRMAVTNPRTREAFDIHWAKALADDAATNVYELIVPRRPGHDFRFRKVRARRAIGVPP